MMSKSFSERNSAAIKACTRLEFLRTTEETILSGSFGADINLANDFIQGKYNSSCNITNFLVYIDGNREGQFFVKIGEPELTKRIGLNFKLGSIPLATVNAYFVAKKGTRYGKL